MSIRLSMKGVRPVALLLAILCGFIGMVAMFVAGSWSGSGDFAVIAACVLFLLCNAGLAGKFPVGSYLYGVLINLPPWLFFIFLADPGQLRGAVWGLVACLVAAYLGMLAGIGLCYLRPRVRTLIVSTSVPAMIIVLVVMFFKVQGPTPVPNDKKDFIGQWRSISGFELQIRADGTASMFKGGLGDRNLEINQAPSVLKLANVDFEGDSIVNIGVPGLYARTYKINRCPYPDSGGYAMMLNGTRLWRQQ